MTAYTDLESEQHALGLLMMNSQQAPLMIIKLDIDDFTHPAHKKAYEVMTDALARNADVGPVSMTHKLEGCDELANMDNGYIASLATACISAPPFESLAERLRSLRLKRGLEQACNSALSQLENGATADEAAIAVNAMAQGVAVGGIENLIKTEKEVAGLLWDDVTRGALPVSTGIKRLDDALDGGLYPNRAYGVLARKKMGKTMLASTVAKNIADGGHRVLFIAAEMGDKEIQERVTCRTMGVYGNAFRSDYRNTDSFAQKFSEAMGKATDNLLYAKAPGVRFEKLKQIITAALVKYKIDGFILDYWQLVGGKGKKNEREHLDEVAQWLADFVHDNDIWCLVMGQENQDGNSRGGEGIRLAFDMVFSLQGDPMEAERWMEMKDTRYTKWMNVGSETAPALRISEKGTHIEELEAGPTYSLA